MARAAAARRRRPFSAAVAVLLVGLAAGAETAEIFGRVELVLPASTLPFDANVYAYRPPRLRPGPPPPPRAVVYLEALAGPLAPRDDPAPATIDQRDETFVPSLVAIQAGATVAFPNSDETYHNVFSLSPTRRFDLGRYPKGASRSVRFDRPGVVRVFCEIHSHMSAVVLVLPHSYFAVTDGTGAYRLAGIPPGRYAVVAWSDRLEPVRREVVLASDDRRREDFRLDRRR